MCTRHYTALFSTQTIYNLSQNMKFILFICKVGVVTRCKNFFFKHEHNNYEHKTK